MALTNTSAPPSVVARMSPPTRKRSEDGSPNCFAPGLLAWLEHAVGWEIDRRTGAIYPLLGPHAAIDDSEIDRSLGALAVLSGCFRHDGRAASVPVADFLELTATVLRAELARTPGYAALASCNGDRESAMSAGLSPPRLGVVRCVPEL